MAVMSAFSVRVALPPRSTPAASTWRMPPRVYTPLYPRHLTGPMAVVPTQGNVGGASTSATPRRGSPLSFLKR
jgi:hypothetical protein